MDAPRTGSTRPLVGRSAELDDLDDVLASVSAGAGAIVLLEGEAGIGKSTLVGAVCASARLLGLPISSATARPGPARPFELLADALLPRPAVPGESLVLDELASLVGSLRGWPASSRATVPDDRTVSARDVAPAAAATRAEELFAAHVRRRGDREPWLLVLEDLHLADDASLAVLYRLAHEGPASGALVLATMRPVPRRAELATVVAAWTRAGARYVEMRPLTVSASLEVAERELGARPGPSLRGSISTAGGNPRFVLDVVRASRDALVRDGLGGVDVADQAWTSRLDAVLATRLEYLGPEVVGLLAQASVLGTSFVVGDLAELSGEPVAVCWRVLRHGLAAGLVHARGDRLVFRHELVRSALYAGLEAPARRALHERAATLLADAGAPPSVVRAHRDLAL